MTAKLQNFNVLINEKKKIREGFRRPFMTIHAEKASSVAELKHFCKEDRAKIPPQWCERGAASYYKRLITAVAAKGDTSSY